MRVDSDTRALVTGASRGIGRALTAALVRRGATVGAAARNADGLEALVAELGPRVLALPCDVADAASTERAVRDFAGRAGGLDLVVANAGIAHYGPFAEQDVELHERMTRVNWLGTLNTVRAALPLLGLNGVAPRAVDALLRRLRGPSAAPRRD